MRKEHAACGQRVTITNRQNGKSIEAIITDRGPFIRDRFVDLGRGGANAIGMVGRRGWLSNEPGTIGV